MPQSSPIMSDSQLSTRNSSFTPMGVLSTVTASTTINGEDGYMEPGEIGRLLSHSSVPVLGEKSTGCSYTYSEGDGDSEDGPADGVTNQSSSSSVKSIKSIDSSTSSQASSLSFFSNTSFPNSSGYSHQSGSKTKVVLKWKETLEYPIEQISLISKDILKAINASATSLTKPILNIDLIYNKDEDVWFVPNLLLPPGVYRLQFLINGMELKHSEYLPTATNDNGNIVNWFEVIHGHDTIEPYREPNISAANLSPSGTRSISSSARPSSRSSMLSSISSGTRLRRSITRYSDYTGARSRSNSRTPRRSANSSFTFTSDNIFTPVADSNALCDVQQKTIYSNEIPELFKANYDNDNDNDNEEALYSAMPDDGHKVFAEPASYGEPSFYNRVVDCNQDYLFATLQQNGAIDATAAESLFLERYPIDELPIYLSSSYLNKTILRENTPRISTDGRDHKSIKDGIPHVNLNHVLTSSIKEGIIGIAMTTRYEGKYITQVMYSPCDV